MRARGIWLDDRQTVVDYLTTWLAEKSRMLKPTTAAVYADYIVKDLIPAFGAIRLEKLNHLHVARFINEQLAAGRGPTMIRRLVATLSSALGDAVRQRRLQHNPARYAHLFEILIGTGLRKGEALALHWTDVHLDKAVLFVRYTLSNIRNTTPVIRADGPEQTIVEVRHRHFERLVAGQDVHDAINGGGGWELLLAGYAETAGAQP